MVLVDPAALWSDIQNTGYNIVLADLRYHSTEHYTGTRASGRTRREAGKKSKGTGWNLGKRNGAFRD